MRVCASCGESNPERARFCLACATPLASPARRHGEERKLVSVLFCDLVGFTARSDRADPEDVRAVLRPYHARLRVELERFGGTVEKFVGDAVMAVFGAPTAYEDDAERAVRAALRILEAIDELNAAEPTLALTVRVGLTTGQVLVALGARPEQGEGIVTGDVVNTAARLQAVAPAGGVVVDETTWRLTRQLVIYEELAPVTVKGKDEPVPVWRATRARNRTGTVRPVATPFVARQDELSMLKAAWRRALREPSVQLVTVVGEPGVGKSRLVRELFVALDAEPQPVAWRQGSCLPYGEGITFWALGEVVKAEAGILESDGPTAAAAKLAAAVEAVEDDPAEREWLKARLAPLVGLGDADRPETAQRAESFAAWGRFLEDVAGRSPLVLVIEDLHWADQALLEFLVHLLEWTTSVPLLLVATARPELHERVAGWGGGVRNATTIALGPLSDADTAWLLSTLLGRSVMPADTQAILLERAGGNPLYAEEFVRLLADRGLLNPDGDGPGLAEVPAPETVQALIAARLDTLSVERKALLQDAAVVGRVFWSGAVAAMGGIDEPEVRQDLHELARKELVRPARRSSVAGQGEYAFWHLLVRDTAYEQIPRAARAGKHRSAAAWIERLAGERVADHAELLAHHYGQALFLARAARLPGAQLAELEQPARHFLIMAGDRTVNLDVVRAEAYYLKALDLCPSGHAARAAVLVKAAGAAIQTGRLEAAESQLQAAIAASGDREDAVIRGDALLVLAGLLWNQGKTGAGRAALLEAIELLEREQPGRRLASAYAGMAANRLHAGRAQEALAWADRTLGLAGDLGVVELKVRGLRLRGVARCDLGDFGGVEDLRTALELALGQGLGFDAATAANDLAESLWLAEGPVSALDAYRTGITRAERRGIGSAATWSRAETLRPLFDLGRWEELLRTADELRRWSKAHGATYLRVLVDVSCAQVLAHRGELAAAISLSADFLTRARDIGDPQAVVPALSTAALLEQARGARTAALALVEELDQGTRDPGAGHLYRGQYLADLARVCVAAQEPGLAQELLDATQAVAARARHGLLTGRAVVAEARGDLDQAARLYGEAAQRWGGYGHVLERAQAWFGEGRCLLRLGRPQARARLDEAREAFAGLGARLLLAQTDQWLARAATRSS